MRRIHMQLLYFGWLGHGHKLLLKYTLPAPDTKTSIAGNPVGVYIYGSHFEPETAVVY
jgi:hypothetical protein